jgi:hypothetical protein
MKTKNKLSQIFLELFKTYGTGAGAGTLCFEKIS